MRCAILMLLGFSTLVACSTSLAPTLPSRATSATHDVRLATLERAPAIAPTPTSSVLRAVPVTVGASPLDLGALAQIVARLPNEFYRFEIDLFICAGAIVAIGIVNACLIASLLAARGSAQRVPLQTKVAIEFDDAIAARVDGVASPPSTVSKPASDTRACACGAPIATRSKSGRCRRCANASRAKRSMHEVTVART